MKVTQMHLAPNGYLHAGSIVTLADTIAGYGCLYNLPGDGVSFTTMELKTNFLSSAKTGILKSRGQLATCGKSNTDLGCNS
jgi:uncharacterized protein (TIGR00369 family)